MEGPTPWRRGSDAQSHLRVAWNSGLDSLGLPVHQHRGQRGEVTHSGPHGVSVTELCLDPSRESIQLTSLWPSDSRMERST